MAITEISQYLTTVTEVFDTELIGEGAIATYRHALDHLLTPDCIAVPSLGRMYVQVRCGISPSLDPFHNILTLSSANIFHF